MILKSLVVLSTIFAASTASASITKYSPAFGLNVGYLWNEQVKKGPYAGLMLGLKRTDCFPVANNKIFVTTCLDRYSFGPFADVQGAEGGHAWATGLYMGKTSISYSLRYSKFTADENSGRQDTQRLVFVYRFFVLNLEAGVIEKDKKIEPSFGLGIGI